MKTKTMTYAQMLQQIAALTEQAEQARQRELGSVLDKIHLLMHEYGITVEDLEAKRKPVLQFKPTKDKVARPMKFHDGKGNGWSGVGKRPDWFKAALAKGKTPEDMLV